MAGIIEEIYISSEKEETAENESTNTTQDETEVKAVNMTYEKSSSNISGRNRSSNGLIMLSTAASDSSGIPEQIVETEVPETEVPETGASALKEIQSPDGSYTGSIKWNPDDDVFQGGVTYQAQNNIGGTGGIYIWK